MPAMPSSRYIFGTLPWYSVLIVTGICIALFLASREEKRLGLSKDTTVDLALWIIPFGVIGARLYYVFFAWDTFKANPVSILYIWQGGLAIYGGVIGGLLAAFLFSRKRKIPLARLTDIIVPGLILAQAIGRWGNYFNMEAYGLEISDPAWQFFPFAVLIPENGSQVWHMATFFYESMWNLAVFAVLMLTRKRMLHPGDLTLWYFSAYGCGRLVIEGLRLDSLWTSGGSARISQLLSVGMCLVVFGLFAWRTLRHVKISKGCIVFISVWAVLTQLLPHPAEAFLGYHWAWSAQTIAVCAMLVITAHCTGASRIRRLWLAAPLLCVVGGLFLRLYLAQTGLSGVEASTLLCILFSLTTIASTVFIYPSIAAKDSAAHSPI